MVSFLVSVLNMAPLHVATLTVQIQRVSTLPLETLDAKIQCMWVCNSL